MKARLLIKYVHYRNTIKLDTKKPAPKNWAGFFVLIGGNQGLVIEE